MFLLQAPEVRDLDVFTTMPEHFRRRERSDWADANPERSQAARVQKDERHDADPIHSVGFGAHLLGAVWTII